MEIYSSDDDSDRLSERFESYSLSADVSESESSTSGLSGRQFACTSNSIASSSSSPRRPRPSLGETSVPSARMNVNLPGLGLRNVVVPRAEKKPESEMSEVELMKERFAKLLLGEDMSGGRKGVCTALAISNAITNLSASVFGELWKLEPLTPQKKSTWRREMDWLLCVSDSIVELTPSVQEFPGGGGALEVMVPRPRSDLHVNLPALKKLDAMLQGILDGFRASEFHYVDHGLLVTGDSPRFPSSVRQEEKWWLPFPKVPQNGLSDEARKRLQQCRECSNQILKAAMAINGNVLAEMDIPNIYLRGLPKSGKACLGEVMHRYMTADKFSPECLLDDLDLSSEFTTLEIANRIEAAVHIWKQKYTKRRLVMSKSGKASWGGKVKGLAGDVEKSKLLAYRAETLLQNLKMRFPGLSQTALDMSKIQFNKDVGHAILESYSRVMEGLAFNIMARIDDLLYIDDATKRRAASESMCLYESTRYGGSLPRQKRVIPNGSFLAQQQQSSHGSSSRKPRPLHRHNRSCGSGIARERTEHSVRIRTSSSDTDDDNKSDKVSD